MRGLEGEHAAVARRTDHRAVGLRADRERHHARRHRRRRARRGAAGRAFGVVRVARLARVIDGELGGHGLAQDHRARGAQALDHRGVPGRPAPGVQHGAVLGRHVAGIDDVLDADRDAVQRPLRPAEPPRLVAAPGLGAGELGIEEGPGLDARFVVGDPGQAGLGQLEGGDLALAQQALRLEAAQRGELHRRHRDCLSVIERRRQPERDRPGRRRPPASTAGRSTGTAGSRFESG